MNTPLPEPDINTASHINTRIVGYTADKVRQYAAEETKRLTAELQAVTAERDALRADVHALLRQIDIGDFLDRHGHSAKMLSAVHDLLGRKA